MMYKRGFSKGQVTLFIIIGLFLIVSGMILYFILSGQEEAESKEALDDVIGSKIDKQNIQSFVTQAIVDVASELVVDMAFRGGTLDPSTDYYHGIGNDRTEISVYAEYQTDRGYVNKIVLSGLLRESIEQEIESRMITGWLNKPGLRDKLDFSIYEDKYGYELSQGQMDIDVKFNDGNVFVKLNYPLSFKKGEEEVDLDDFSVNLDIPFGRLYAVSVDIANDEIEDGHFIKEDYMLSMGGEVRIEKLRSYPDVVYEVSEYVESIDDDIVYRFAIKGKDTVTKEVLDYENAYGCCNYSYDGYNLKNVPSTYCRGPGLSENPDKDCIAFPVADLLADGCCDVSGQCSLTFQDTCESMGGTFYYGDMDCKVSGCDNLGCSNTYLRQADYSGESNIFSGQDRLHGDSWCSYEGRVGAGEDYAGSRHYLHSCINGVEYVEPCRDYREEICSYQFIGNPSQGRRSKAACRTNRWYDCYYQTNKADCEDNSLRDCVWTDFYYNPDEKKCHPAVSPGMKFWESDPRVDNVCTMANQWIESEKQWKHRYTMSEGAYVYCRRMGDCGYGYNMLGELGIVSRYQWGNKKDISVAEVIDVPPFSDLGDYFAIKRGIYELYYDKNALLAPGISGGHAWCHLWVPQYHSSSDSYCSLCTDVDQELSPCTVYKCRSFGMECQFYEHPNGTVECSDSIDVDLSEPNIEVEVIGYNKELEGESYGVPVYSISPSIDSHKKFNISIESDINTTCSLSLGVEEPFASMIQAMGISSFVLLNQNGGRLKDKYLVEMRLPNTNSYVDEIMIEVNCGTYQGVSSKVKLKFNLSDRPDNSNPKVLGIETYGNGLVDGENNVLLYVDKPSTTCSYSYGSGESVPYKEQDCRIYPVGQDMSSLSTPSIAYPGISSQINDLMLKETYKEVLDSGIINSDLWIEGQVKYEDVGMLGSYPCFLQINKTDLIGDTDMLNIKCTSITDSQGDNVEFMVGEI